MPPIPNSLLSYFSANIKKQGDTYIIEVPEHEIDNGSLELDSQHKVAVFGSEEEQENQSVTPSEQELTSGMTPPVREGETRTVEIIDKGSEGDGITRINEGYVLIVPDGAVGETLEVEVVSVNPNFAIGEKIKEE